MLFNSIQFLVFLPVVLTVYYLLGHKAQNRFLLAASCFFYACWDWRFLLPLLVSTSIDYWCAKRLEHGYREGQSKRSRSRYLAVSVVTNLGLLGFFKYYNFFAGSLHDLLYTFGYDASISTLRIILPVGISFYTFQALSYTIDVYRGELHATNSFLDFLLCVLYFPHLVAGPIQRAHSLLPQVIRPRRIFASEVIAGLHLIVWGYFKKVFIADQLAPTVADIFSRPHADGFAVMMGAYAFAFQIYCDFSGYTDIARGVAKMMGFEFVLNFNLPYFSTNPKEFWSRWHISLSSWLRDYLYIPLGGSQKGERRTYINLFLTMVIGGLWHGAAWTFVIWGAYQGTLLVVHRALAPYLARFPIPRGGAWNGFWKWTRIAIFFQFVCYGWLIFRAQSFTQLLDMTLALRTPLAGLDPTLAVHVFTLAAPLILVQFLQYFTGQLDFSKWRYSTWETRAALYAAMLYLVLFHGGRPEAFIYFQF